MIRPTEKAREVVRRGVTAAHAEGRPVRVLYVCLGNICRSPAAQGVTEAMAAARDMSADIECDSAGFYGGHRGEMPDRRMRQAAFARGYRLEHRSRTVNDGDFDRFDIIVGMDDNNLASLHRAAPTVEDEAKIIGMADFAVNHPDEFYVPDPYYEGPAGFILVLNLLEDACGTLLGLIASDR